MKDETILVTGGAGFIGSNLVRRLLQEGYRSVTVLDNLSTGYLENLEGLEGSLRFVEGDVRDRELVGKLCKDSAYIFHMAAHVGNVKSIEAPDSDAAINITGTLNILDATKDSGKLRRLVYSSSAACYGEPLYLPVDEKHLLSPDSPYGVSKMAAEKYVMCYEKTHGVPVACLRYFNAYGTNQRYDAYGNVLPIFVERILEGKGITVFGDGEQTRDFVNVDDIVQANILAMELDGPGGIFNVATGEQTTINGLVELLRGQVGRHFEVEYAAPRKGEVRDSYADISLSRKELGFKSEVGMAEGVKAYIEWYKSYLRTKGEING